ncbi:MAG: V-type ATPase subunit a family protein, partial [archaeon]|nr:V-type ATPase subunit a family protein [archaeon]
EINPAFFNIVTFPFTFGIMFGDVGHGLVIFIFALYMLIKADEIKAAKDKSMLKDIVKYRYFLFLLSLASIYCGLLYNDFLSVPLSFFKSCYQNRDEDFTDIFNKEEDCVYPFGLDPKWFVAENELTFFNSFKMKFSVIFGIIQMILGILLKGLNDIHFGDWAAIIFEFIPQLIFMFILFGYMVFMIFLKWTKNYDNNPSKAPSLITLMINIVIKSGSVEDTPLWGEYDESSKTYTQEKFHNLIFIISIILIPIMMFPKPIIDYIIYNRKKEDNIDLNLGVNENMIEGKKDSGESMEVGNLHTSMIKKKVKMQKGFLDFIINQSIIIVEFVLGTVSNTASYLRLWALSLAHVELTKVFFEKTLKGFISDGDFSYGLGLLFVIGAYIVWANVTFFVLICMDFMECFLHTLRLHWVEFQNKFYHADGYLFLPFSFKTIIQEEE